MILAPRKHLFATNIIFFCLIFILQKLITIFCIIEHKTGSNDDCMSPERCSAQCANNNNNNRSSGNDNGGRFKGRKKLTTNVLPTAGGGLFTVAEEDEEDAPCCGMRRCSGSGGGGGGGGILPAALRKTMQMFGYGEGHYQIFVEEKQRLPSKACLDAAVAELKLNPN